MKKWKDTPCSWIGRIKLLKMTILSKVIYRLSAIPNCQWHLSENKKFYILYGNTTPSSQIVKAVLRKKNGAGVIMLPDLRLYYKAIGIKTEI